MVIRSLGHFKMIHVILYYRFVNRSQQWRRYLMRSRQMIQHLLPLRMRSHTCWHVTPRPMAAQRAVPTKFPRSPTSIVMKMNRSCSTLSPGMHNAALSVQTLSCIWPRPSYKLDKVIDSWGASLITSMKYWWTCQRSKPLIARPSWSLTTTAAMTTATPAAYWQHAPPQHGWQQWQPPSHLWPQQQQQHQGQLDVWKSQDPLWLRQHYPNIQWGCSASQNMCQPPKPQCTAPISTSTAHHNESGSFHLSDLLNSGDNSFVRTKTAVDDALGSLNDDGASASESIRTNASAAETSTATDGETGQNQ